MSMTAEGWRREPVSESCRAAGQAGAGGGLSLSGLGVRIGQMLAAACRRAWAGIEVRRAAQRRRTLRVVETVGMGEKRFVAIVEVEEQRFLVGGGSAGVSLLARLDLAGGPDPAAERECAATPDFAAVLERQQVDPASSAARVASGMGEAW